MSTTVEILSPETDALRRICNYPMAIGRALIAISENPLFMRDMPGAYLPVLLQIVKKISVATPSQEIFARRATIANESQKSIETVGRTIRWLEEQGFITREQKAHAGLRGSTCHIHPTKKFTNLLGLHIRTQSPRQLAIKSPTPSVKKRNFIKIDGKNIPAELAWMVQQGGILVTGLLKLMKLAKESGKRLSDVVQVAHDYLSVLRGRELFSYALTLIRQNKDYGFIANKDRQVEEKRMQTIHEKELLKRKCFEWKGRKLINRAGSHSYLVNESGVIDVKYGKINAVQAMDMRFIDAVDDGQLRFI